MVSLFSMQLCDIYEGLGDQAFRDLLKAISLGKLRTYQLFERLKVRLRLNKLNTESLAKSAPRQWERIVKERDDAFAMELGQAVLVCHMDVIVDVLDHLQIPHQEGFFEKDADISKFLTGEWQQRAWDAFSEKHPRAVLAFYLNHLAVEMTKEPVLFNPLATAAK
ncbi:MAG: hypothetical protein HYX27_08010 [Acidobacteria bacterium]|nr:hypothetical protein [Acidobacteriota bacterium]